MHRIHFLFFSKYDIWLCKDLRADIRYFDRVFQELFRISNPDRNTLDISCSGFSLSVFMPEKTEVFCRILVGDIPFHIMVRYSLDCLTILGCVCLLSALVNAYLDFGWTNELYFVPIFIVNILISARQVRKHESI